MEQGPREDMSADSSLSQKLREAREAGKEEEIEALSEKLKTNIGTTIAQNEKKAKEVKDMPELAE